MRVAVGFAVYRTVDFGVLAGVLDLWTTSMSQSDGTSKDIRERFDALNVSIMPMAVRGYGGGRSTHRLYKIAAENGADVLLTIEADMTFGAVHVVRLLEAYAFLAALVGGPVAVGSVYPASSGHDQHVMHHLHPDEESRRGPVKDRIVSAVEDAEAHSGIGDPRHPGRFMEVETLPYGFSVWPVQPIADADIAEVCTPDLMAGFDAVSSAYAREHGVRLFVDLSLDVRHLTADPLSSYQKIKRQNGAT